MTLDRALELAGDLDRMDVETMEEIANAMPRYLWIIDHWMDDTGLPEYDIHATDDARLLHCEACGHETVELARGRRYATPLPHNTEMSCPLCGQRVTVKHVTRGIKGMHDRLNVIFARKSEADPDVVLLIAAMAWRWFRDADVTEPWNLETALSVTEFAVFDAAHRDDLKVKRAPVDYDSDKGQWGWYYKAVKRVNTLNFGGWHYGYFSEPPTRVFYDSISRAVEDTTLGRAYRDSYAEGDCAYLLDLLTRYPATEYVSRLGLGALIIRHIECTLPERMINWRGKNMSNVLRLSRDRIAQAKGKGVHLTPELIAVLQTVDGMGVPCGIETAEGVARACRGLDKRLPHDLREAVQRFQGSRRKKTLKYIARMSSDHRLHDIEDYWQMCERAGNDLRDDGEAFPRDFRLAHDRAAHRVKLLADAYKDRQIAQRLDDLDARFGFTFGGLILRPAVSCEEVVREGEVLHHCVGSYVERYAGGGTAIFVLRRAAQPDAPWRTVEIDPVHGTLLQDRGLHNDWGQYQIDDTYRAALEMFWQAWRERPKQKARKSA